MKRSEVNAHVRDAAAFFKRMRFNLPPWAFWSLHTWKKQAKNAGEIIENMLGWDITDFGSNDFKKRGLFLFTLRNGALKKGAKPYAEKIMIVDELQETPMHFHWNKMEDIINRGGGNLVIQLFNAAKDESLAKTAVTVSVDGVQRTVRAGQTVVLKPGESICLTPRLYHRFFGQKHKGRVLVGEVSMVNDDSRDNRFYETVGRFPEIEEDAAALRLLAADYKKFLN